VNRLLRTKDYALALVLFLIFIVGCDRSSTQPAPLPVEQVPAALQKAFNKAQPDAKELVNQIVTALGAQDYSKAYTELQNLSAKPGLNKEQQNVTSRGVLTVNNLLQSAQTKGDVQATETLRSYRVNK
jgi:hypothetical protein